MDNAPEDVFEDAELRFRLRQDNTEQLHENVELAIKRAEKLEAEGGCQKAHGPAQLVL